ncbi:MAG: carotenoid oxygenase family protein [Caldiserica bacterium]|nr:carotenoid oxygenase family protein [Caldisericota bacterium]
MNPRVPPRYGIGFASLLDEAYKAPLSMTGVLPPGLAGTMYRIGPGRFQIGVHSVGHWLDGFALLSSVSFGRHGVTCSNRFLASSWYRRALIEDAIPAGAFDSQSIHRGRHLSNDNANMNITIWKDELEALGDTPQSILIDRATLATIRTKRWAHLRRCCASSPHPVVDRMTGERFDLLLSNGEPAGYVIAVTSPEGATRRLCTIPSARLGYMHSFSVTPRWIVLVEGPFTAHPRSLSSSRRPYLRNYVWDAGRGTRILVIDRNTGTLNTALFTRPLFALHQINAWDDGDRIVVDLAAYADPSILDSLTFDHGDVPAGDFPAPLATRLAIDVEHKRVLCSPLRCPPGEFCTIDSRFSMHSHTTMFAAGPTRTGQLIDRLCRSDLTTGGFIEWSSDNCFPGAPVFVPEAVDSPEGQGWLLSVVLDVREQRSFVLILNAATMIEQARAWLPWTLPFGLHALFVPEETTP